MSEKAIKHHHWHYIYRRRREVRGFSSGEIVIGQITAMSGSLLAGYLLELNKHTIALFAGAFLLLPGIIDLAASITGAMCAKINHRLEMDKRTFRVVEHSMLFALLLSITSGAVVGVVGGSIGQLFFDGNFLDIFLLALATLVTVGLIVYPIMAILTLLIRRTGADPDNIIGPLETGVTDALTVLVVCAIIRMLT